MIEQLEKIKLKDGWENCEEILYDAYQKGIQSEEMFFALLKTYTSECLYGPVNQTIAKGMYENLQGYFSLTLRTLKDHGPKHTYKQWDKPVYRGLNPNSPFYNKDEYARNSVASWTAF